MTLQSIGHKMHRRPRRMEQKTVAALALCRRLNDADVMRMILRKCSLFPGTETRVHEDGEIFIKYVSWNVREISATYLIQKPAALAEETFDGYRFDQVDVSDDDAMPDQTPNLRRCSHTFVQWLQNVDGVLKWVCSVEGELGAEDTLTAILQL